MLTADAKLPYVPMSAAQGVELADEATLTIAWPAGEPPLVSVVCVTYNHEAFIKTALRGFLVQATEFPFEVLVHDDASSDRTPEIIRDYASRYPRIVKPICQQENQYSKGRKIIPPLLAMALGKYVALCDGDDLWVDARKLARQVAILEANQGLDLCWHDCRVLDCRTGRVSPRRAAHTPVGHVPVSEVIANDGGFVPTPSLLMRRSAIEDMPEWFLRYAPISDYFYQIYAARRGGGYYLEDPMAVYRSNHAGSWTSHNWHDTNRRLRFEQAFHKCVELAEKDFAGLSSSFSSLIFQHFTRLGLFALRHRSREIFDFAQATVAARAGDFRHVEAAIASIVFLRLWRAFLR